MSCFHWFYKEIPIILPFSVTYPVNTVFKLSKHPLDGSTEIFEYALHSLVTSHYPGNELHALRPQFYSGVLVETIRIQNGGRREKKGRKERNKIQGEAKIPLEEAGKFT